ncbi:MAG: hypothetical protein M0036_25175 [Desulfobacteraceae bacterium]|nr:hypothetical protein [Desulfobacteraceae bacterium]
MSRKFLAHPSALILIAVTIMTAVAFWGCSATKRVGPIGPDGKPLTWSEMNIEQRKLHMKKVVLPLATTIFQQWRPERYAKVDCTLCHGVGDYTGDYHMPTDHLPRLSGELFLGPERAKYPDTTELKLNRLVPEMADALGVKRFNLITRRGFGCYSCHLGPKGPMFGH